MKKNRSIAIILILAMLMLTMAGMTSCSENNEPKLRENDAVIVLGIHKNFSYETVLEDDIFKEMVRSYIYWGRNVTIISDGGQADIIQKIKTIDYTGLSISQRLRKSQEETDQLIAKLKNYIPEHPEVDVLGALNISCLLGESDIYIYDSGLQTTGAFITDKCFFVADFDAVIEELESIHEVPCMTGMVVTWLGFGSVCDTQQRFSNEISHNLRTFWTALLEASGANLTFDMTPIKIANNSNKDLPDVTAIDMDSSRVSITKLTETELGFVPNKANFQNCTIAETIINKIATDLADYSGTIYVVGSTASLGTQNSCKSLSKKRAEAVGNLLTKKLKNEIVCIGIGRSKSKFRVNDLDANGRLIESNAKNNRVVYVFTEDTEYYKIAKAEGII